MKKYLYLLLGIIIAIPTIAWGVNISVPQATSFGQLLRGNANGTYTPVATSTLGIPGNPDFTYNTDIGFGVTGSATGTKTHFTAGIHASGTSQIDNATSTMQTIKDALWLPFHTSALMLTDTNGKVGEYTGTTCTNQFTRALSALGVATCETVSLTADVTGTLPVANGGTGSTTLSQILVGNGTSAVTSYGGTSCTNQFPRSLNGSGVATCATVGAADVSLANLTATDGTLTFSGTYTGAAARTIGLNLGNANAWTVTSTTTFAGAVGVGTSTASQVYAMFTAKAKSTTLDIAHFFNSVGTKILALTEAGATALGTWDFSGATLRMPYSASPTVVTGGDFGFDTNNKQLKIFDGDGVTVITGTTSPALNFASTTLDASGKSMNIGTSTFLMKNDPEPFTLIGFYCKASTTGTVHVRFGDGTNWTEMGSCTTGSFTRTSTNNTWTQWEDFNVQASSTATLNPVNRVTITTVINKTAQ